MANVVLNCCILYYADKSNEALKAGDIKKSQAAYNIYQRLMLLSCKTTLDTDDMAYLDCYCKRCGTPYLVADSNRVEPTPPQGDGIERGYACADHWVSPIDPVVYASDIVSEVTIWRYWKDLNTADGVYDFAPLLSDISDCITAGKKVSLKIAAGNKTPAWVLALVPNSTFNELQHVSTSTTLTSFVQPVFWDAAFKGYWKTFITELTTALAPYWANILSITANGLNRSSAELRIPAQVINNGTWTIDSPTQWLGLGYTTQLFMDTYVEFNDHLVASIPASVDIIQPMIPNTTPNVGDGRNALREIIDLMALDTTRYYLLDTYITETFNGNSLDNYAKSKSIKVLGQLAEQYFDTAGNNTNYATALQKFIDWGGYPRMEIWEDNPVDYLIELTLKKPIYS